MFPRFEKIIIGIRKEYLSISFGGRIFFMVVYLNRNKLHWIPFLVISWRLVARTMIDLSKKSSPRFSHWQLLLFEVNSVWNSGNFHDWHKLSTSCLQLMVITFCNNGCPQYCTWSGEACMRSCSSKSCSQIAFLDWDRSFPNFLFYSVHFRSKYLKLQPFRFQWNLWASNKYIHV